MPRQPAKRICWAGLALCVLLLTPLLRAEENLRVFNVKSYGATGKKADDAQKAIQKAVDDCAQAGGGTVYLPPGEYTSGTIYLRSHVRFYIDQGATLFASKDRAAYSLPAAYSGKPNSGWLHSLFMAVDLENITLEGRGTVDGQGEYEWRKVERSSIQSGIVPGMETLLERAEARGRPLMRPYPKGYEPDNPNVWYPHLVVLLRCKDVRISGLSFLRSWSWTIYPYACERMVIDGVYIYTSLQEACWADGIDLDSCKDVHIANCTIATGDDCIIFISENIAGPPLVCENVTITNCHFSSASVAIKFSEGIRVGVRSIVVDNCVIDDCDRGITFETIRGGYITDVVVSNLTIDLHRFDAFFPYRLFSHMVNASPFAFITQRESEWNKQPLQPGEPPPGSIRNVMIRNVIAHVQGSSIISGHPESWLDGISFDNVKLFLSTDPEALYDRSVNALNFRWVRNLKLKDVEVIWDKPALDKWESALSFEDINGLELDDFTGRQAWVDREVPAVVLKNVSGAMVRNSQASPGTGVFLKVLGPDSRGIGLYGNDFRQAKVPYQLDSDVGKDAVTAFDNFLPSM